MESAALNHPVLIYDGECGFCNSSIRFVLRHDRRSVLMFAPSQGSTAAEALRDSGLPSDIGSKSIVLAENGEYLIRSRAALRTMKLMGGVWPVPARVLGFAPVAIADRIYDFVARIRGRLPHSRSCEMVSPEDRVRFLP